MNTIKLIGSFAQIVYGPKGNVEGFLIRVDGQPVQVVIDKDDDKTRRTRWIELDVPAPQILTQQADVKPRPTPPRQAEIRDGVRGHRRGRERGDRAQRDVEVAS